MEQEGVGGIPEQLRQKNKESIDFQIIQDIEYHDAGQISKLRKQLQDRYIANENRKVQNYVKQTGRSESLHTSMNQAKPVIEFQDSKNAFKKKNHKGQQDPGHSFYGPVQQNQVNQKISSIKDSIASAYLQSESSLSPFIQVYLKQALKLQNNPTKRITTTATTVNQGLMNNNKQTNNESIDSLKENDDQMEDSQIEEDLTVQKHNLLNHTNKLVDTEMLEADKNNVNYQIPLGQSPMKSNKQSFIKDKLERMHCISGDCLIESGLRQVKNNILNTQNQEFSTLQDDSEDILEEMNSTQDRNRVKMKKRYQRQSHRIKTASDDDFYSHYPNNQSFYDNYTKNNQTTTRMNTDTNNNKTEVSENQQSRRLNTYWSINYPEQQKRSISGKEYLRNKSKETDISVSGLGQEQSSKLKPQRAQSQGPKSGQAIQSIFYNADPNNTLLKDFFGQVENVNLNNIFINQLGITDEQRNKMFDKMDEDTKNQIQQKIIVQEKMSKYTKQGTNYFDEFQQSFKNNFQFIEDETKSSKDPQSFMHIKSAQKNRNESSHALSSANKRSLSIQKKRVSYPYQADPETIERFQTPINIGKLVNYSRIRTESDVLADIGQLQSTQPKKEYPLYINRVNRVRLQSFSSSKNEKKKDIYRSDQKHYQENNNNTAATQNENKQQQYIKSFIDPRKVYRQNLEVYQNLKNIQETNAKMTEQLIQVTQLKTSNQSDGFPTKVFFQNQDLKRKLQVSNVKLNI